MHASYENLAERVEAREEGFPKNRAGTIRGFHAKSTQILRKLVFEKIIIESGLNQSVARNSIRA